LKKLTQTIYGGGKIIFPGCKTFVFLTCDTPVDFNFITVFNRVERTIEQFSDTFSVTAENYFLRVEVSSSVTQEITVILLDDTKIEYRPLKDRVTVDEGDINIHGECAISHGLIKVANRGDYGVQIGANVPVMTTHVLDKVKYQRAGVEGAEAWYWYNKGSIGGSNLNLWSPCFYTNSSFPNYYARYLYLERIKIKPTIDTHLEIWGNPIIGSGSALPFYFASLHKVEHMDNIQAKVTDNFVFGYRDEPHSLFHSDVKNKLFVSYPCPANVLTEFKPLYPFQFLQGTLYTSSKLFSTEFLTTITTEDECEYDIYVEGVSFLYSRTNDPSRWDSHMTNIEYP